MGRKLNNSKLNPCHSGSSEQLAAVPRDNSGRRQASGLSGDDNRTFGQPYQGTRDTNSRRLSREFYADRTRRISVGD